MSVTRLLGTYLIKLNSMSKISISSASITAPMGMVVGTAKVSPDIQEPSLARLAYRRANRGMTTLETVKPSLGTDSLRPSRKRRTKRRKRSTWPELRRNRSKSQEGEVPSNPFMPQVLKQT